MSKLKFSIERLNQTSKTINYETNLILCLGFAGRDQEAVQAHIDELKAIGVECPDETPVIYPAAGLMATTENEIQVIGEKTGPEIEFAFLPYEDKMLVGLASDHTDRELEAVSITKAKQICPKVISSVLWDYEDIKDHWDKLILKGWIKDDNKEKLYQDSDATALLSVEDLLKHAEKDYKLEPGIMVLSGTVPTVGDMATPTYFKAALIDPVLDRKIQIEYNVTILEK